MAHKTRQSLETLLQPEQSLRERAESLRNIKNYIAGHDLRKTQYVRDGLISRLADIVEELNPDTTADSNHDAETKEIWIQAANITCILAHGGPKFVHLILQSTLLQSLVVCLSSGLHSRQTLLVLNALSTTADNLPLSAPNAWHVDRRLAELLYGTTSDINFTKLLSPVSESSLSNQIFEAAATLICKTCHTQRQKLAVVQQGALIVLCQRLAAFVVLQGLVIPAQQSPGIEMSEPDLFSQPAPSLAQFAPTIETIAVLIEISKESSYSFVCNDSIQQVFPPKVYDTPHFDGRDTSWSGHEDTISKAPLDIFLPSVPSDSVGDFAERSGFPPLGTPVIATKKRQPSLRPTALPAISTTLSNITSEKDEHLIVPWLLYVARTYSGRLRLVTCQLLAILLLHGLVTPARAGSFGTLLIPVLIRMLDEQNSSDEQMPLLLTGLHYSQAVPAVLASLIQDDPGMQRVAFEAKAIPKLATSLRSTFEQAENHYGELWVPQKSQDNTAFSTGSSGYGGPLMDARHIMTFREGLLQALAAIAPSDDTYRKEICDQGVLVQIMLALEPFQYQFSSRPSPESPTLSSGNSTSTLLAACNAVRALTRSVTALRTKLVDADVGKAIMKLMYNPDPEVRIAATRVIANLAMDFSPLKATISEPDLIKKLCEQAHSANARLRLESVWALKSLVLNAPNKLKRDVIDELGSNWIKHLIETDPYDIPPGVVIGLSEREYPPRASFDTEHSSDDVVMDEDLDSDSPDTGIMPDNHDLPEPFNKHTVEDDLAIQEQLIDLIRNLFCGETASEIVEYLVGEIGSDTFIDILVDRLRPRLATSDSKLTHTKPSTSREMIVKVLYVVMHIAACAPRFRNMISRNTTLMRVIAGFCSHEDPEIRVQCCWVIINLTYEDDLSDREACRVRAIEIQKAGFQGLMRRLESDPEPNVRERAKTAVHLLLKMM